MKELAALTATLMIHALLPAQTGWVQLQSGTTEDLWGMADFPVPIATGDNGTALWDPNEQPEWVSINPPPGTNYRAFKSSLNPSDNWLIGEGGVVWFTDGGATTGTWVIRSVPAYTGTLHALFGDNWLIGDDGLVAHWNSAPPDPHWDIRTGLTSSDLNDGGGALSTVLMAGAGGTCLRSTDDGANWTHPDMLTTEDILGVKLSNSTSPSAMAVGRGGVIRKSSDDGATWTVVNSGVTTDLYSVFGYSNTWFACGAGGVILRSTDQGVTWHQQATPTTEDLHCIHAYYDFTFGPYCVGAHGTILHTDNLGGSPMGITEAAVSPLAIYPQPAGDHLSLILPEGQVVEGIELIGEDGRLLKSYGAGGGKRDLDVRDLATGCYVLRVHTTTGLLDERIVIAR